MSKIKVLDCTLRDGGYVNSWNFGKLNISDIITQLLASKVDVIECGFLSSPRDLVMVLFYFHQSNILHTFFFSLLIKFRFAKHKFIFLPFCLKAD